MQERRLEMMPSSPLICRPFWILSRRTTGGHFNPFQLNSFPKVSSMESTPTPCNPDPSPSQAFIMRNQQTHVVPTLPRIACQISDGETGHAILGRGPPASRGISRMVLVWRCSYATKRSNPRLWQVVDLWMLKRALAYQNKPKSFYISVVGNHHHSKSWSLRMILTKDIHGILLQSKNMSEARGIQTKINQLLTQDPMEGWYEGRMVCSC